MGAPTIAPRRMAPGAHAKVNWSHPLARGLMGVGCGLIEWAHVAGRPVQPSPAQAHIPGLNGMGLDGNSSGGGVTYRLPDNTFSTSITVAAWTYLDPTNGSRGGIVGWTDGSGGNGLFLGCGSGNLDAAGFELILGECNIAWRSSSYTVPTGGWHHLACTADKTANVSVFYVDGKRVATSTTSYNTTAASASYLINGGEHGSGRRQEAGGYRDVWAVWNRILTANEIARVFDDPFCMIGV